MIGNGDIQSLMNNYFSKCPICKLKADFSTINEKKAKVQCNHCEAAWRLFLNQAKDEVISLKLEQPDKENLSKDLKNTHKVLGFWQNYPVLDYNFLVNKKINKSYRTSIANDPEKQEIGFQELEGFGDLATYYLLGVFIGEIQASTISISKILELIKKLSNPCCLPDLIRIYESGRWNVYKLSLLVTIFAIIPISESGIHYIDFLKDVWKNDQDPNARYLAISGLIKNIGQPDIGDLIPSILEMMAKERDVDARGNNIYRLQPLVDDERVIDFLIQSLPDESRPKVDLELPTSWLEAAKEVLKIFNTLTIGELAANILIESGNQRGIESILEAIIDNKMDAFILRFKRIKYMFKRYPYAKDYLLKIIQESKDQKRRQNAAGLLKIGGVLPGKPQTENRKDPVEEIIRQGQMALINHDYVTAEECYKKALDIDPGNADHHSRIGVLYFKKGENEKAMEAYKKAIQIDPNHALAHGNLALAYATVGNFKDAKNTLNKAKSLGYKNWAVIQERIKNLSSKKK